MHLEDLVEVPADEVVPHVAVHLLRVVVAVEDLAQRIDDDDRGEDGVEEHHVVALGDLQARFEVLDVGDVLEVRRVPGDDAALVPHHPGGVQHAPRAAGSSCHQVRFQVVHHVRFRQAQDLVLQLRQVRVQSGDVRQLLPLVPADELVERGVGAA